MLKKKKVKKRIKRDRAIFHCRIDRIGNGEKKKKRKKINKKKKQMKA